VLSVIFSATCHKLGHFSGFYINYLNSQRDGHSQHLHLQLKAINFILISSQYVFAKKKNLFLNNNWNKSQPERDMIIWVAIWCGERDGKILRVYARIDWKYFTVNLFLKVKILYAHLAAIKILLCLIGKCWRKLCSNASKKC
jgi:hypothetical protein